MDGAADVRALIAALGADLIADCLTFENPTQLTRSTFWHHAARQQAAAQGRKPEAARGGKLSFVRPPLIGRGVTCQ